jgi:predicted GIY-YIG superfamily endonuclease
MANVSVYWIHHPEHTDIFTQGYIGITKDIKKRWSDHAKRTGNAHLLHAIKKYGWDNLVKEVILVADKAYCLMIEVKLRSHNQIGWNIAKGGGNPPICTRTGWKHTKETNEKNRLAHLGKTLSIESRKKISERLKQVPCATRFQVGKPSPRKGVKVGREALEHLYIKLTCPHCNKIGTVGGMTRWHMNNCRFKENK